MNKRRLEPAARAILATALVVMSFTGCAKVRFYSDSSLQSETGLRFYTARPYLLVARTGAKDKPMEVSVVYLPDLQNPQYAYYRAGIGSNTLTVALTNSIATSYGQTSDAKLPETLTAIGSLVASAAGVPKLLGDAEKVRAEAKQLREEASTEEIRKAAEIVKGVSKDLKAVVKEMGAKLNRFVADEALKIATELDGIGAALEGPQALKQLDGIVNRLRGTTEEVRWKKLEHKPMGGDPIDVNARFDQDRKQLQSALALLAPPAPKQPEPAFELYEIQQDLSGTRLIRVPN